MLLMGPSLRFGTLCDRFGSAPTIAGRRWLYVLALIVTATLHNGTCWSGAHAGRYRPVGSVLRPVLGVILRVAPRRSGPGGRHLLAGGSFRPVLHRAVGGGLQNQLGGWRPTMWALTGLALLIMLLSIGLNDSKERSRPPTGPAGDRQSAGSALSEAFWPTQLRLAGDRLLSSAASMSPSSAATCRLHLRQGNRPVAVRHYLSPAEWAAGRSAWSACSNRRFHPVERNGRPAQAQEPLVRCSTCCARWCSWASSWRRCRRLGADFAGALGFLWLGTVPLTTSLVGYIFGRPSHHAEWRRLLRPSGRQLSSAAGAADGCSTCRPITT